VGTTLTIRETTNPRRDNRIAIVAAVTVPIVAIAAVAPYVIWDREFRRASSTNPASGVRRSYSPKDAGR